MRVNGDSELGDLTAEGVLEPDRFPGHLTKRDRYLEQHSGNLAWPVVFAEVGDRLDAYEPSVGTVPQRHWNADRGVLP